jgi:hypothetical protein
LLVFFEDLAEFQVRINFKKKRGAQHTGDVAMRSDNVSGEYCASIGGCQTCAFLFSNSV